MAAVSIPPSPHAIVTMAGGRAPLSNLPNGGNSPYRARSAAPMKRPRPQTNPAIDLAYAQPPPPKKQIVERDQYAPRTPSKRTQALDMGAAASPMLKAQAAKTKTAASNPSKQEKPDEGLETLRTWQKHYKKVFPSFVFYFDSVTDEARRQCSRGIQALGAVSSLAIRMCFHYWSIMLTVCS